MASIPLPALDVRPPQQQENPLDQYTRLLQLKGMMANQPLQNQLLQQQVQQSQTQNEMMQRQLAASKALQAASAGAMSTDEAGKPTFDPEKFQQGIAGTAAFTPETIENLTKMQQARVALQTSQVDLQNKVADMKGYAAAAIKAANYDPSVAHSLLDSLNVQGPQAQQIRSVIDNPQALKQWVDTTVAQSPKQQEMANQRQVAGIRAATPEMQSMQDWLAKNPGKGPADYQQHKQDMEAQRQISVETNPAVVAVKAKLAGIEAAARQAVSQGDPGAAGQLLVNGDATLSELKARGATPDFIARTLFAANKLSGGKYNAAAADAQYSAAKSEDNVKFFGSANSLLDRGGTLDQLEAAGKEIPQGQLPVFNSIADAEKAATGSGPIAKYASLALGVADDYSKVMGGGQGSDTSRAQALKLISANQSPEQRAASVEGIRGAVSSQTNSRMGKNPYLRRMYASDNTAQPSATQTASNFAVKAPNGKTYTFKSQADADAFKQKAGIQ